MMFVYYVSHILTGAEFQYSPLEKRIFNLVVLAWKLKPYFQAHPIVMLTNVPLQQVIHKPDLTGRMTKWVLELSEYQIAFQLRKAKNAKVLADFIVENTSFSAVETSSTPNQLDSNRAQILHVDSSAGQQYKWVGFMLDDTHDTKFACTLQYDFPMSNNESEYEAALAGL